MEIQELPVCLLAQELSVVLAIRAHPVTMASKAKRDDLVVMANKAKESPVHQDMPEVQERLVQWDHQVLSEQSVHLAHLEPVANLVIRELMVMLADRVILVNAVNLATMQTIVRARRRRAAVVDYHQQLCHHQLRVVDSRQNSRTTVARLVS